MRMRLFDIEYRMRSDATAIRPMEGDAKKVTVRIEVDGEGTSEASIERIASSYAMDKADRQKWLRQVSRRFHRVLLAWNPDILQEHLIAGRFE